jgi:outer membrane receptor protein involved in Fe transport
LSGVTTFQYVAPAGFSSDHLSNNELGLRSEFLDHRVLLNASAYYMHWDDVQQLVYDPSNLGTAPFNANGSSYTIAGVELQFVARATEGLTVQGAASWNSAQQTDTPCLSSVGVTAKTANNPTPPGQCITIIKGLEYANPYGAHGSSLPYAPPLMFNVRARYELALAACRPFAWAGVSHIGSMHNAPENYPDGNELAQNPPTTALLRYAIPGYTLYDAALGVTRDNWTVQLTGSNLTNADAATNISSAQFIKAEIPLRPRVLMAQLSYRY